MSEQGDGMESAGGSDGALRLEVGHLVGRTGGVLGASGWREITQEQVNAFADATGDHQWIHTDPQRAQEGPFGTTIAHGFLTLSLIPALLADVVQVQGAALTVNYGLGKVRFPSPVPVGSRVRATVELREVVEVSGGVQAVFGCTVEREGGDKPCCVAESLLRFYT